MRFSLRSPGFRIAAIVATAVLVAAGTMSAQFLRSTHAAPAAGVAPNAVNNMDCNGWSKQYTSVRPGMRELCTDPVAFVNGHRTRLIDNNWYVGHDEPSVKFISSANKSGNQMSYYMQLAVDPTGTPTTSPSGTTVTDYAELSPAPWFGLPICDPNSFPNGGCTPDSDTNDPNAAGSAFMELQFYPPGYAPFVDGPSCDATHYCAALTIDSLEVITQGPNAGFLNPNCVEPVNFAYLQDNGKPAGPPSPQLTDDRTFTPNGRTLLMNQGDTLHVSIHDTGNGFMTRVDDLTTGQSGFMTASAQNGFMNTDPNTCNGFPFTFHAEYATAAQQNQVPWAALEGGVLMEDELGHFEPCASVSGNFPLNITYADGRTFSDPQMFTQCNGPFEPGGVGEGAPTQEGNQPCTPSAAAVGNCEFSDAQCFAAGPRTFYNNGVAETTSWPVSGCQANFVQNGDLDGLRRQRLYRRLAGRLVHAPDIVPVPRAVRRERQSLPVDPIRGECWGLRE
jgi:hypothetical protein